MNFALSVIYSVQNLKAASLFFQKPLGFQKISQDPYGIVLSNHSIQIRLREVSELPPQSQLVLELSSNDLEKSMRKWREHPETKVVSNIIKVSQERHEVHVKGPYNIELVLFRLYDEDQLGIMPDLPTELDWSEYAEETIKKLLRCVPVPFRQEARVEVTNKTEMNAAEEGQISVNVEVALRSLVEAMPTFQYGALWEEMERMGFDPSLYLAEKPSELDEKEL